MQTYVESAPVPALRDVVRVTWVQRVGARPYAQRHLPTGGVELHCPIGSPPRLLGPLTGARLEVLAPGTVLVGVRLRPGAAQALLGLPACELVDLALDLADVCGPAAVVLGELLAAGRQESAPAVLAEWLTRRRAGAEPDALVAEAVRLLTPWRPGSSDTAGSLGGLGDGLGISASQLRRRCLAAVGIGPKALQRTLRFQGFLALVQSGAAGGLAGLAADAGYADHAHLTRECVRLTGLPPSAFLGDVAGKCACGHDHSASFVPILRGRRALVPA